MTDERLMEIFLESTPKINERFYPNEYISILANKATGLIQAEKQSEVCENCSYCVTIWKENNSFSHFFCGKHHARIEKLEEQSCRKDFKRKEGK